MTYIALLRGINVGGNNIIKMADLRDCFLEVGYKNVRTYIQSGNVVFETNKVATAKLEKDIENALNTKFEYKGFVVVVTESEFSSIVEEAIKLKDDFGQNTKYKYDVIFMKKPMRASAAALDIPLREGVDAIYVGKKALYFSRLTEELSKSALHKITSLPVYKRITIRNWNTTIKLLELAKKK